MNRTIATIFIAFVLCGCMTPDQSTQSVVVSAGGVTSSVPVAVISTAAATLCTALGFPVAAGGVGTVIVAGFAIWAWWYRNRRRNDESEK